MCKFHPELFVFIYIFFSIFFSDGVQKPKVT